MTKREKGRKAVETMLAHGMSFAAINEILGAMPAHQFTNGAYELLLEKMAEAKP